MSLGVRISSEASPQIDESCGRYRYRDRVRCRRFDPDPDPDPDTDTDPDTDPDTDGLGWSDASSKLDPSASI